MITPKPRRFEPLESRRCLTVVVEVDGGDLLVSGDADGDDSVSVGSDATVEGSVRANLGAGQNNLTHAGVIK